MQELTDMKIMPKYLNVAVCTGEHVMNVRSMPKNRIGATVYRSLQSDMHMPWNAPIGGLVVFIVIFGVIVEMSSGVVVGTVVVPVEFSSKKLLYISVSATQLQLLYILK